MVLLVQTNKPPWYFYIHEQLGCKFNLSQPPWLGVLILKQFVWRNFYTFDVYNFDEEVSQSLVRCRHLIDKCIVPTLEMGLSHKQELDNFLKSSWVVSKCPIVIKCPCCGDKIVLIKRVEDDINDELTFHMDRNIVIPIAHRHHNTIRQYLDCDTTDIEDEVVNNKIMTSINTAGIMDMLWRVSQWN